MTRIKICGLTRDEDVSCVNSLLPDYAGFVFAKGRRRYISPDTAERFRSGLDERITTVGVFVDEDPDIIAEIAGRGIIGCVQLHGRESEEYIGRVKSMTGLPVIKAFRIESEADAAAAESSCADMILLDTGAGGTGETFDHTVLNVMKRPYFIAGGLSPENVGMIMYGYHPYGLDVSSGVETNGNKDPEKIRQFIETVSMNDEI
ncbi:MAG: phosphoribosylanthranilate isomerase [Ruminiclostridium sp.]|nr:phosphoribosylanthranilate isomerase [Ruminiclostridium sp.]